MTVFDNLTYLKFSKIKVISNLHESFRLGEPLNAKWIYILHSFRNTTIDILYNYKSTSR